MKLKLILCAMLIPTLLLAEKKYLQIDDAETLPWDVAGSSSLPYSWTNDPAVAKLTITAGDLDGGGNDATNFANLIVGMIGQTGAVFGITTNLGILDLTVPSGGGSGTTNADGIHVVLSPTSYTAATPDAEAHFVGIDNELTNSLQLGVTDSTAYRGDHGAAASNLAYSASTNAEAARVTGTNALVQALASMTNYVPVASSTNWLAYDRATRLLSGCVTNAGGGDLSGWSGYAATQQISQAIAGGLEVGYTWDAMVSPDSAASSLGGVAEFSNKFFVVGGSLSTTNVYSFDGVSWSSEPGLPTAQNLIKCVVLGDYLYTITSATNVYRFDNTSWEAVTACPLTVGSCIGADAYDGKIIVTGWDVTNAYTFDGTNWAEIMGLPVAVAMPACATLGDYYYCIGGQVSAAATTNVYRWDGSVWEEVVGAPEATYHYSDDCFALGDWIYMASGKYPQGTNIYKFDGIDWEEITGAPSGKNCYQALLGTYDGSLFFGRQDEPKNSTNWYVSVGVGFGTNKFGYSDYNTFMIDESAWIEKECSAEIFVDRTPYPASTEAAIIAIKSAKPKIEKTVTQQVIWDSVSWDDETQTNVYVNKRTISVTNDIIVGIDHAKLDPFLQGKKGGRDLSATVSVLMEVVKDLLSRVGKLEPDEKTP